MSLPESSHAEEHQQLVALYALGVLDHPEQQEFERHLAECSNCQTLLAHDRRTLAWLGAAQPELEPPPDFKQRLLDHGA